MSGLCILIPAFNAERTLPRVLAEVLKTGHPVLVVDDGSADGTAATACSFAVEELLSHPENRGKGAALKTGFNRAFERGFSHALTLDADGQHPVDAVPLFVETCREEPRAILVGNRFGCGNDRSMPRVRWWSNTISSRLISLAAGTRIPDAQCGMRVYPLDEILRLGLESEGYALESEVLVKAGRRGIKVVNIPISCHYPEGTSTSGYRPVVDSWRIAKIVLRSVRSSRNRPPVS